MRRSSLALVVSSLAVGLGSVAPLAAQVPRPPMPVLQAATFDVASAFQQHFRATIEPLVFGRFSLALSGEFTTQPETPGYNVTVFQVDCAIGATCPPVPSYDGSGYRAWSFNVHGRWYPGALSFSGARQSAAFYVGEYIGYHERRTSQPLYYPCYGCVAEPPRPDSTPVLRPQPYPGGGGSFTQVLRGWEPGAEFGVRVQPLRHVVMDVGARFRLARLDDYQSGTRPGGIDSRLVVSLGVGW